MECTNILPNRLYGVAVEFPQFLTFHFSNHCSCPNHQNSSPNPQSAQPCFLPQHAEKSSTSIILIRQSLYLQKSYFFCTLYFLLVPLNKYCFKVPVLFKY